MKRQSPKDSAEIAVFKARLMVYNKECDEKVEREKVTLLLKDKLAVIDLEHDLHNEINKLDFLEEGLSAKELEGDMVRIAKPGYAQAQDPLIKINFGDEGECLPTFIN
ncbi:hypothetical protein Adt_42148 [Abeliophyllum distichum]|uniref:Uncharacterized protein n=1 Tax=Abeliophyllum distichum TaxID=126358 RepID=A0ABD1PRR3_9LAMI